VTRAVAAAALALAVALTATSPRPAWARSQTTVTYPADRVFAAAIRFVRVDLDAKILDRDADAGFVVFEYIDDGKPYRSALEVVATDKGVSIILDIADRPDYLEQVLLDRLRRRLRDDLGDEPRPDASGQAGPGQAGDAGARPRPASPVIRSGRRLVSTGRTPCRPVALPPRPPIPTSP
jgi:hypothetical protein